MLVIKRFSERKKVLRKKEKTKKFRAKRNCFSAGNGARSRRNIRNVVKQRVQVRRIVDVVFDNALGGVGDEEVVVREGMVVISSSLDMLTNNCLGGIMVSLIFLEGLDEETLVEFMIPKGVCQNAEIIDVPKWDSGQLHINSEGHSRRIRDL
ncbi:hypothetical protein Tco_0586177 [Tanacetum coccineum]